MQHFVRSNINTRVGTVKVEGNVSVFCRSDNEVSIGRHETWIPFFVDGSNNHQTCYQDQPEDGSHCGPAMV